MVTAKQSILVNLKGLYNSNQMNKNNLKKVKFRHAIGKKIKPLTGVKRKLLIGKGG